MKRNAGETTLNMFQWTCKITLEVPCTHLIAFHKRTLGHRMQNIQPLTKLVRPHLSPVKFKLQYQYEHNHLVVFSQLDTSLVFSGFVTARTGLSRTKRMDKKGTKRHADIVINSVIKSQTVHFWIRGGGGVKSKHTMQIPATEHCNTHSERVSLP